jgi:hypothetical protein
MAYLLRGALIEYGSDFLGPLPNVVIFQFNPETLTRTITVPPRPTGAAPHETGQAGEPPLQRFTVKAEFDASDQISTGNVVSLAFGVGPSLAALEKMVQPSNLLGGLLGKAVDAIAGALGGGAPRAEQPVPRETYPRILFLWGLTRVLPVTIESMSITEQKYDRLLNPVRAEVTIGLAVTNLTSSSNDTVGYGALTYSRAASEVQAVANLANTLPLITEMIPF